MSSSDQIEDTYLEDADLPAGMQELRKLIGLPALIVLVKHYGGLELKVPQRFDPDSHLVRLIGEEPTLAMINRYCGDKVYISKLDMVLRLQRNIEIAQRLEAGQSARRLARIYNLSERQIWKIVKRPETLRAPRPEQNDLFN